MDFLISLVDRYAWLEEQIPILINRLQAVEESGKYVEIEGMLYVPGDIIRKLGDELNSLFGEYQELRKIIESLDLDTLYEIWNKSIVFQDKDQCVLRITFLIELINRRKEIENERSQTRGNS